MPRSRLKANPLRHNTTGCTLLYPCHHRINQRWRRARHPHIRRTCDGRLWWHWRRFFKQVANVHVFQSNTFILGSLFGLQAGIPHCQFVILCIIREESAFVARSMLTVGSLAKMRVTFDWLPT
jgi:hypothetical protein